MRIGGRTLTRVERVLVFVFGALVLGIGVDTALSELYLGPRDELRAQIAQAETALDRARRLEARAAEIQRAYEQLQTRQDPDAVVVHSESGVLLEIEKLARDRVRLLSLQPRAHEVDGRPMLHLSIEASGGLLGFGEFLRATIEGLGGAVSAFTLTPDAAGSDESTIRSRVELEVVYDGS